MADLEVARLCDIDPCKDFLANSLAMQLIPVFEHIEKVLAMECI